MKPPSDPYRRLLDYSLNVLAQRAYSEAKLREKIVTKAQKLGCYPSSVDAEEGVERPDELINKVVSRLKELKYLDDEKFVANYLDYHLGSRPEGKYGFIQRMRKAGIATPMATGIWQKTLNTKEMSELELACQLVVSQKRKYAADPPLKRKQKLAALLSRRGFSADVVWDAVSRGLADS